MKLVTTQVRMLELHLNLFNSSLKMVRNNTHAIELPNKFHKHTTVDTYNLSVSLFTLWWQRYTIGSLSGLTYLTKSLIFFSKKGFISITIVTVTIKGFKYSFFVWNVLCLWSWSFVHESLQCTRLRENKEEIQKALFTIAFLPNPHYFQSVHIYMCVITDSVTYY